MINRRKAFEDLDRDPSAITMDMECQLLPYHTGAQLIKEMTTVILPSGWAMQMDDALLKTWISLIEAILRSMPSQYSLHLGLRVTIGGEHKAYVTSQVRLFWIRARADWDEWDSERYCLANVSDIHQVISISQYAMASRNSLEMAIRELLSRRYDIMNYVQNIPDWHRRPQVIREIQPTRFKRKMEHETFWLKGEGHFRTIGEVRQFVPFDYVEPVEAIAVENGEA